MTWRQHLRLLVIAFSPTAFMVEMIRMDIESYHSAMDALVGAAMSKKKP